MRFMKRQEEIQILKYMKLINRLVILGLFIGQAGAFAQSSKRVVVDKIVAKVDDYIILKSELERSYLEVMSRGEYAGSETKCQILEGLVLNKLMAAKAEIDSIVVTDERVELDLDMRMQQIVNQMGGDEDAIEKYYGKTLEEFKDELREQVREQLVVQEVQRTIVEGLTITPEEVKRFFKNIPRDSLPYFSSEVVVGHIVKKPSVNQAAKKEAERFLYDLRERAEKGEDFLELVSTYSQDPSARYGKTLGWVKRGQMVPEFEAAAMKLKPGEMSKPVETEYGIHLIKQIDRRGNEYHPAHILILHKYMEEDFAQAAHFLDSIKTLIENDSITFAKAAKEFSEDKQTAGSGGFMISSTGSVKVPISELDGDLYFTIDSMQVGTITSPMKFKTANGKDAVRIIYYKEKYKPHQANLKEDYQKIQMAAKNAKQSKIMNEWFMDAINDVYIEIDPEYQHCNILE